MTPSSVGAVEGYRCDSAHVHLCPIGMEERHDIIADLEKGLAVM